MVSANCAEQNNVCSVLSIPWGLLNAYERGVSEERAFRDLFATDFVREATSAAELQDYEWYRRPAHQLIPQRDIVSCLGVDYVSWDDTGIYIREGLEFPFFGRELSSPGGYFRKALSDPVFAQSFEKGVWVFPSREKELEGLPAFASPVRLGTFTIGVVIKLRELSWLLDDAGFVLRDPNPVRRFQLRRKGMAMSGISLDLFVGDDNLLTVFFSARLDRPRGVKVKDFVKAVYGKQFLGRPLRIVTYGSTTWIEIAINFSLASKTADITNVAACIIKCADLADEFRNFAAEVSSEIRAAIDSPDIPVLPNPFELECAAVEWDDYCLPDRKDKLWSVYRALAASPRLDCQYWTHKTLGRSFIHVILNPQGRRDFMQGFIYLSDGGEEITICCIDAVRPGSAIGNKDLVGYLMGAQGEGPLIHSELDWRVIFAEGRGESVGLYGLRFRTIDEIAKLKQWELVHLVYFGLFGVSGSSSCAPALYDHQEFDCEPTVDGKNDLRAFDALPRGYPKWQGWEPARPRLRTNKQIGLGYWAPTNEERFGASGGR